MVFNFDLTSCLALHLVNDTMDDIFEESGDEEESQDIVNQVLDEIGIEISGKVRLQRQLKFFFFLCSTGPIQSLQQEPFYCRC